MKVPGEAIALLDSIETTEALDVLCLVARDPTAAWSLEEIARCAGIQQQAVHRAVRHLHGQGLLVELGARGVRFATPDEPLDAGRLALLRFYDRERELVTQALSARASEN